MIDDNHVTSLNVGQFWTPRSVGALTLRLTNFNVSSMGISPELTCARAYVKPMKRQGITHNVDELDSFIDSIGDDDDDL